MTQQQHVFYRDPSIYQVSTQVLDVRYKNDAIAIAAVDNLMRAAGGGEPADRGTISISSSECLRVDRVFKDHGLTWMQLDCSPLGLQSGQPLDISINGQHRDRRRKLHTAAHLALRATQDVVGKISVVAADIDDDARFVHIAAGARAAVSDRKICEIDRRMRSLVLRGAPVTVLKAKSIDRAAADLGSLLRVSDRYAFKGRVRLVVVDGIDANPCSGLHAETSNIGPYVMTPRSSSRENLLDVDITLSDTWMYWFGE